MCKMFFEKIRIDKGCVVEESRLLFSVKTEKDKDSC